MATRLAAEMPISHHYGPVESPLVPIDRNYAFRHYRPIHGMGLHRSQTYQSVTETVDSPMQELSGPGRLLLLAFPAAAEVWSGWVGIAQKTGFGLVSPPPGIWSSFHLDTTITLPIGVEAYAAYALRAWLATEPWISPRTRRFAKWSAICSFALGMAGQVAYHLLVQAGESRAPWGITTVVSCLPVLVLAMGTALAHMLRGDASAGDTSDNLSAGPARRPDGPGPRDKDHRPDQSPCENQRAPALTRPGITTQPRQAARPRSPAPAERAGIPHRPRAGRRRETRVAAGTAQRRSQGVQRETERARPSCSTPNWRTGRRSSRRRPGRAAFNCCSANSPSKTCCLSTEVHGRLPISAPVAVLSCCTAGRVCLSPGSYL
jgi:hypothetical protein